MNIESYILVLMAGLLIKHFLADFQFQTLWMVKNKGVYGHPGGLAHAGTHAGLSLPVLLIGGIPPMLALAVCAGEFVIHYHVDFIKEIEGRRQDVSMHEKGYWVLFGMDQLAHQLTYVLMIAVAMNLG